jgi:hypothetical protein
VVVHDLDQGVILIGSHLPTFPPPRQPTSIIYVDTGESNRTALPDTTYLYAMLERDRMKVAEQRKADERREQQRVKDMKDGWKRALKHAHKRGR